MAASGAERVRLTFNPSNNPEVQDIKARTASLIDACDEIAVIKNGNGEAMRLIALAKTAYEEAAMWAVKAATA